MSRLEALTQQLAAAAGEYDRDGAWPQKSLAAVADAGLFRAVIPRRWGGDESPPRAILEGYEAVGRGCMSALLILTQRDSACELIFGSANDAISERWMPRFACNEAFTTVGIAQVTTSHQAGPPALAARPANGGYALRGFMPWATGAEKSDVIVTAAVLADQRQILVALPPQRPGVRIEPPMQLLALSASRTSRVRCDDVEITTDDVLRGPAEKVLAHRSTVKPMVVSSSGLGLAGALVDVLDEYRPGAPADLGAAFDALRDSYRSIRARLYEIADRLHAAGGTEEYSSDIRIEVNDLVVRLALAAMTLAKGSGFVRGHRVERLLREAMFFLVWAATDAVRVKTLQRLFGQPMPKAED